MTVRVVDMNPILETDTLPRLVLTLCCGSVNRELFLSRILLLHQYRSWISLLNIRVCVLLPSSIGLDPRMLPPFNGRLEVIRENVEEKLEALGCLSTRPVFGKEQICTGSCLLLENESQSEVLSRANRISPSSIESVLKKALKTQARWLETHFGEFVDFNFPACYDLSDPQVWGIAKR